MPTASTRIHRARHRTASDYEYERSMRYINSDLRPSISTVFLMPPREFAEVLSTMVKGMVGLTAGATWCAAIRRNRFRQMLKRSRRQRVKRKTNAVLKTFQTALCLSRFIDSEMHKKVIRNSMLQRRRFGLINPTLRDGLQMCWLCNPTSPAESFQHSAFCQLSLFRGNFTPWQSLLWALWPYSQCRTAQASKSCGLPTSGAAGSFINKPSPAAAKLRARPNPVPVRSVCF